MHKVKQAVSQEVRFRAVADLHSYLLEGYIFDYVFLFCFRFPLKAHYLCLIFILENREMMLSTRNDKLTEALEDANRLFTGGKMVARNRYLYLLLSPPRPLYIWKWCLK